MACALCAPASTGEACTLEIKVKILETLMRATQETEQPIAQASQGLHRNDGKKMRPYARGNLHLNQKNGLGEA
ncbi:MAG: hypothetical protein ACYC9L_16280 [Sulfuricaulis sp.]